MAEARWRTAARARVFSAHGYCIGAWHRLDAALRDLQDRDDEGRYVRLDAAANNVYEASWFLSASMGHMAAAELLALRGCALVPADPVASTSDLRDGVDAHHNVWLALIRLQSAREHGQDALDAAETASGNLWAANFMVAHLPPAAGLDAVMQEQVDAAVNRIGAVMEGMVDMPKYIVLAAEPPARIAWK